MLLFAIGKPMAYHGKFAVKRTAKSTLANYGKLSRAKHRGKKRSPASQKRTANNCIFTFPIVKATHCLPQYFSLLINKRKMAHLPIFAKKIGKTAINHGLTFLYPFGESGKNAVFCQKISLLAIDHFSVASVSWSSRPLALTAN